MTCLFHTRTGHAKNPWAFMSVHQARIAHAKHLPALPSRPIIVTHSALLKFLSLFNASGISHRLPFCTSQLFCPAFAMWFNPGLPLSFPVHCLVLMLSRPFFVTPACWLLLILGLMPCLVISLQSPIITNMASVLKLSVTFVFTETHQRSMT